LVCESWVPEIRLNVAGSRERVGAWEVAFTITASAVRAVTVTVGSATQEVIVGASWQRYVVALPQSAGTSPSVLFGIGKDNASDLWLDGIHAYRGNPNVFRRDFDHGAVVVNMTGQPAVVGLEAGAFRQLTGCQDERRRVRERKRHDRTPRRVDPLGGSGGIVSVRALEGQRVSASGRRRDCSV
jgi:hypothetical protein